MKLRFAVALLAAAGRVAAPGFVIDRHLNEPRSARHFRIEPLVQYADAEANQWRSDLGAITRALPHVHHALSSAHLICREAHRSRAHLA